MREPASRKMSLTVILACGLAIWALARPSQGIRHDAILYMAQTMSRVWPEVFSHDVFFAFGSQDNFSVYSWLMARVLSAGWMVQAEPLLLWLSHAGLLAGTWMLLSRSAMPRLLAAGGLVAVAGLSHLYGGRHLIAFGEEFLTARTVAEPLVLLALAWQVQGRSLGWVLAMLLLAGAFHPLIALPGVLVVWVMLCLQRRTWLWGLAVLPLLLGLGAAGVAPLDRVLTRYDEAWWSAVRSFNRMVLISSWREVDGLIVSFDVLVVAVASRILAAQGDERLARLLRASVIVAVLCLVVSVLFGDVLRNVLVLSIQLWRSLWILHLLALAVLPWLVWRAWRLGERGRFLALSLVLAGTSLNWEQGWVFLPWLLLAAWLNRSRVVISPALMRILQGFTALVTVFVACWSLWLSLKMAQVGGRYTDLGVWNMAMQAPALALLVGMGLLWLMSSAQAVRRGAGFALLALLCLTGAAGWDQRDAWDRHVDGSMYETHPFQRFIAPQQQVYWDHEVQGAWFMLRRASYFSVNQGGGVLFNRQTAMEFMRRSEIFSMLETQRTTCALFVSLNGSEAGDAAENCYPTREIVEQICQTEPALDFMVFGRDLGTGKVAEWSPPPELNAPHKTYRLYACSSFRPSHAQ